MFEPDWLSPPGDTICDLMEVKRVSRSQLAKLFRRRPEEISPLLNGEEEISYSTATILASVFGVSKEFWMRREEQYRRDFERLNPESWLSELPVKDMSRFGWLQGKSLSDLLRFFGVSTVEKWNTLYGALIPETAFRTSPSFQSEKGATAAWLRRGEIEGESVTCEVWNAQKLRNALGDIRMLTRESDPEIFIPKLRDICGSCGVAVAVVPAPSGCRASGGTRFVRQDRALLLLSFRYLSDDHFWFTFFHEVGHLLLHNRKELFLEGVPSKREQDEIEANDFAAETLIPDEFRGEFERLPAQAKPIIRFARKLGIAPGIVVGQLQHYGYVPQSWLNGVKRRYTWK